MYPTFAQFTPITCTLGTTRVGRSPIRATIDIDVHSVAQLFRTRPATITGEREGELVIIELKASVNDEDALRKIVSQLGWRLSRDSKYVRGISAHGL
jgi:hypothetical protein